MSDGNPSLPDFPGDEADEELVFDDFEMVAAAEAAPIEAPAPVLEVAEPQPEPRRVPRRGRKAAGETPSTEHVAEIEAPAPSESAEAPEPAAEAEEPAGGTSAPFPPRETVPAGSNPHRLLLAIVCLALFTSLISLGGLIAVSRTLARAGVAREEAVAERDALRRVPQLVQHLDDASARLDAAASRLAVASPNGAPASVADVQHQLDMLRLALDQRQPAGVSSLNDMTRSGFSEIGTRLDRIQAKLGVLPSHPPKQDQDDDGN
ncbi:hypothetical protein HZF05_02415 [Sphingomonas sp. CGMCC 1.13654]|uniref:Uncharacterized protein n=1 Tax=Sphingomonas chungangi TaxID=2683589 RepID=A0A838L342_9SPHN|nr:hypothetical protein [Sphingomonas chungangi]MBA2932942.1 hypothetical protein [Sphingomonas chungangi]MVW56562.1 hypothetical protein [Sphingomonas chungangi]